jgi:hypothetical protein
MRDCWNYDPNKRSIFEKLVEILGQILWETVNQEYINTFNLTELRSHVKL